MLLYLLIIAVANVMLMALHLGTDPIWRIALYAVGGTVAVIALDSLGAFVIRQLPEKYFDAEHCQMSIGKDERRFYKRIGIKKWKDRIPELGQFTGFHKNKVADRSDAAYLGRFILECNYGVFIHIQNALCGPLLLLFLPPGYAWYISAFNFVLSLLPAFVLRYNLSTLQYLYKKARA